MKRLLSTLAILAVNAYTVSAQQAYMADERVAVFQPAGFDPAQHLPSPIFVRDLVPQGNVPANWQLKPSFSQKDGKNIATFHVGDADLYGTGEVRGPLRRNGDRNYFWNLDNGAYGHNNGKQLYQTHPWVLGLRKDGTAFGIIADNTWKMELFCDADVRFESYGPAFRAVVIERNTAEEVLAELGKLSGCMELPPLWTLGYHQCRYSYHPESRVREIADTMRIKQMPCDVIWMDIHYMQDYRIFTFHKDEFPNPKATNDYLHSKHFKSVYMIDPGIKVDPNYFVDQQGTAGDYYVRDAEGKVFEGKVWPGMCHFPDFTRPDVRHWWGTLYKDFMAQGVDGVWNDMNEPAVFEGVNMSMPEDNVHRGGDGLAAGPHLRYHNQYGYNMVKASREGILNANPSKRPFVLSRANFLGGQRYAATWTGDNYSAWDQLTDAIPMTLNMGLSGQAFNGPDIGGFLGDSNAEMLAHWTAMGVFFPFVRNHTVDGSHSQEPWAFGEKCEQACRTALNRRYRLLPYIYTLFHESSTTGMPVMRPTWMADVHDPSLRAEQTTFLLGRDMLIIPRWAKDCHLPSGDWDLMPLEDTTDDYQCYVAQRPGSIVPLAQLYQNTVDYRTDSLTLYVNVDANGEASGTMYEDAGEGFAYRTGDYAVYELKATTEGKKLNVSLTQTKGNRTAGKRYIRVAQVADGKVTYSAWAEGLSTTVKATKDTPEGLNKSKLALIDVPK